MLSPKQYLIILIVADVVMIGIFIVVANVHVPLQPNLIRQFNPDAEGNLASWYASSKLLTAALMIGVVAAVNEYKKLAPILLALIFSPSRRTRLRKSTRSWGWRFRWSSHRKGSHFREHRRRTIGPIYLRRQRCC